MIALVDTDILIDLAMNREPHSGPAFDLFTTLQEFPDSAYIAWHSASNFYYLVRPMRGKAESLEFLRDLMRFIKVADTSREDLLYAIGLEMPDFEDALQVAAALACKADFIVTRNQRDYKKSSVRVVSPKEAVRLLRRLLSS